MNYNQRAPTVPSLHLGPFYSHESTGVTAKGFRVLGHLDQPKG